MPRNEFEIGKDAYLDSHLKPLYIGENITTLELAESSARFTGKLQIDRIDGSVTQVSGNISTVGNINLQSSGKLHFDSEISESVPEVQGGDSYIYVEDDVMYFYVGGEKLLTISQFFGLGTVDKIATFGSNLSIESGQSLKFEGQTGDTYMGYHSGDNDFNFYFNNVKKMWFGEAGHIAVSNDLYLENSEWFDNGTDGQVILKNSSAQTLWSATNNGVFANRFYMDEQDGDTYIRQDGSDAVELYVNNTKMLEILDGGTPIINMPATTALYFDGGTDTYIKEQSADVLKIVVGSDMMMQLSEKGDDGNEVSFGSSCAGFTQIEPTYNATTTIVDFRHSNKQFVTFGSGNITNVSLIFPLVSGNFVLLVKQDGTGSRTITNYKAIEFDESAADGSAAVVWAGGSNPTLTTDANHVDILSFYWDADNEIAYGVATLDFQF